MTNKIPSYVKDYYVENIDIGQGSVMSIAGETTAKEYRTYLKSLESEGFDFYADNKIGENLYATYINDELIVNVMYIDAFAEVRVIVDKRSVFALPGLESENIYENTSESSLTLLSDAAVAWPGRMGYAYKLADGSFFLIDGGYTELGRYGNTSSDYIMAVLEKLADDPNNIRIAAWLITHNHDDHNGGFIDIANDESRRKRITIEKIIHNMCSDDEFRAHSGEGLVGWGKTYENAINLFAPKEIIKAHPGNVIHLRNAKITIYSSQELVLYSKDTETGERHIHLHEENDASIVNKVEFMGKTTLYLGDSCYYANRDALGPVYKEALDADILQVAHHGYINTCGGAIYQYINPSIVFWPVCRNHFWGKHIGYKERGTDYMGVMDVDFNQKFFEEGVTNYVHEEECVTFRNFDTWEGERWDAVPEEMARMRKMKVSDDIKYIGVNDYEIDLFEGQYRVPKGMAYNSYVILDEKIAVMDTVDARFGDEWLANLETVTDGRKPDYLIVQHMEPDHSANISVFLDKYPEAQVISTDKSFVMMKQFFGNEYADRRVVVKDGDTFSLGKHTLTFVGAPMVHWPEVIVTYDSYDKVFFSADAFGKFGAIDSTDSWSTEARRYYFGIVGKYGAQAQKLLQKAAGLDISKICPLHGPVLSKNLKKYLDFYNMWTSYAVESKGVVIAYTSVYGNTKKAVELLKEELEKNGCPKVIVRDLARGDMSEAVTDAFRYGKIVLATTTYNGDIFPFMRDFIHEICERNYQSRTVGIIENGTWAPMAAKKIRSMLEGCKNITFAENTVTLRSAVNEDNKDQIAALARELCAE